MLQKLLMLTPFRSKWGTCVMQNWIANFDPGNPRGMLVPTWVTLRRVPDEFQGVARQIAQCLGEVLGGDKNNSTLEDQRFCLALPAGEGWEPSVTVTNATSGFSSTIIIDYINLPIRCRFCLDTDHRVKDCPGLANPRTRDTPPAIANSEQRPALSVPSQGLPPPPPGPPPARALKLPPNPQPAAKHPKAGIGDKRNPAPSSTLPSAEDSSRKKTDRSNAPPPLIAPAKNPNLPQNQIATAASSSTLKPVESNSRTTSSDASTAGPVPCFTDYVRPSKGKKKKKKFSIVATCC